jgi:DNA polymerase III subunit gamma/tau
LLDLALAGGVQLGEFVDQILDYQRDLMVIAAGSESASLQSVASSNRPILSEQAQKWGLPTIVSALQILAETKTRMQRSGMGRALAELALVRLCLLEETLDLASLVEDLRSGPGDAGPKGSASPAASRAPSHARSLKTPSAPANTAIGNTVGIQAEMDRSKTPSSTVGSESQVANVPAAAEKFELGFEARHAQAIWAQIASRIDVKDFLGRALTKVSRTAISGPNQLEVFFPSAYHGNKTHCEQPTALGRLEKVASEVVGKPVKVVCRLEADAAESSAAEKPQESSTTPTVEESRPENPSGINDPYVERARTIFGATIENVTVANHRPARGPTDDPESARES